MKSTRFLLNLLSLACLAGLLAIAACNEDEETPGANNGFSINGTFYPTQLGYLNERKIGETVFLYELYLTSEPIDISDPNFLEADFNSLDIIAFGLIPAEPDVIPTGMISYADFDNPSLTDPEFFASVGIDLNRTEENGVVFDIADGNLTLNLQDKTYSLTFELTTDDNETVTGNFRGELTEN